ncbi:MAG: hypothetical protein FD155_555 [Bacteroidetes bacterium]|nr:MAG: hypothetical protein FD155_555 [Bacteroidota bacterium]
MNINELLESKAKISITATGEDLLMFADYLLEKKTRALEEAVISDKAETYPSPKQVAEILGVDLSTLWRWTRKNYLVPVEIGGKRRYKMSDVKALLNGGKR